MAKNMNDLFNNLELPPVDYIQLTISEDELEKLGSITGIVDKLVILQSLENLPALDEGSVIFLSPTEPLGRVFEVFGPVNKPFYSVRFNSHEDIIEKGITIDTFVMFAPQKEDLALYVLVENLKLQKGSDASWKNDDEPPEELIDFSDDEEEKAAKQKKKSKSRKQNDYISYQKKGNMPPGGFQMPGMFPGGAGAFAGGFGGGGAGFNPFAFVFGRR